VLIPIIREIQFFKERDIKAEDLVEIAYRLKHDFIPANQNVFSYGKQKLLRVLGTLGDKFYVVLKGEVEVLIPNPKAGQPKNTR
jgi:hypothetical protein